MSFEPVTYCTKCTEPFDVYRAPDERVRETCLERAVYYDGERLEKAIGLIAQATLFLKGSLALPTAEAFMDGIEDDLGAAKAKLRSALDVTEAKIAEMEGVRP